MSDTLTKQCKRCLEVKLLEQFPRWRTQYQKRCKSCFARSLKEKFDERQAIAHGLRAGVDITQFQTLKELPREFFKQT
jgi:hypothetical protein